MPLNEIILQSAQLADWYGAQLVATKASTSAPTVGVKPSLLGDYTKRTLILVDEPGHTYLSDPDLNFLAGILGACKLNLGDVGILNVNTLKNYNASRIQEEYQPETCWVFGIEPTRIEWKESANALKKVFMAPALRELSANPEAKRRLWMELKEHYGA